MKQLPEDILRKLKAVIRRIEVAAAFDCIGNDDFNTATSVATLSRISGRSERSLRDYFKDYTGQTLVKYVSARRAEYAARLFRLFPDTSKFEAARTIGFMYPNGIYALMRKNGVTDIDSLRNGMPRPTDILPYRTECLQDCILFYRQEDVFYQDCSKIEFEADNWDAVENYVTTKFPKAKLSGYVGFAIDRYITNDTESGVFLSGILYSDISACDLKPDMLGEIGWRTIFSKDYAVFTYQGAYKGLDNFYNQVLSTLHQTKA
ncbi:MAG: hypothetical protein K2I83_02415, partial [Bacteroidales bacterium]|nr:hypothetical protein [Bacteroidales bacterium]